MTTLDELDLKILDRLQQNNRETNLRLARKVGLSPAACLRRVSRLRASGVIRSDVSLVDPNAVGVPITLVVEVKLERENRGATEAFGRAVQAERAVLQCWYVTGESDFILVIRVGAMAEYEPLCGRLFVDRHVERFRTMVVMRELKFDTALPIPLAARAGRTK
jgi:Lrp/AsnC family transcriptional regulator, leucine-responsive regulatory protein